MDPAKAQFLFGEAAGTVDPDDPDAWADLLEVDPDEPLAATRTTVRQLVAQQIVGDDPPEVWATARRIAEAGREPAQAIHQLSMALMYALEQSLSGDGSSFERSLYLELLERLPLPRAVEVEEAVIAEARTRHPIASEELERLALERLGRAGDPLTGRMVEHMVDRLGDLEVLAWLPGDEIVHVGELTRSIVLTHRLTAMERERGLLWADVALAGFMTHGHLSLSGGGELEIVELEDGRLAWEGPEEWLTSFAEGSLLAVRIGEQEVVEIEELIAAPAAEDGLVGRLRAVYLREVEEPWLPVRAADLVLGLLAEDRSTFDRPQPPLDALCEAAGLERRGQSLAHDASVWANSLRMGRLSRVMDRLPDREDRSDAMFVFDVADNPDPTTEDLLRALDALREPLVARAVADELLPSDDLSPEALEEARAFAERLVARAKGSRRTSAAHWLAAVAAERAGDVLAADTHLSVALREDPMWEPVVERAAWYASDRGDAAAALELWGRLADPNPQDVATVGPFAQAPGHRLGRNDPCWCGSGRKYKACHLDKPAAASLPDRVGWLCRKATAFLEHQGGEATEQMMANAFARAVNPEDDGSVLEAFEDPIVTDAALTEGGWFECFVTERGPLLPDDEALLARSWTLVDRSVYEVVDVRPGSGLTVRDLRTGDRLAVRERTFSLQAQPKDLVCGRVVPDGDTNQFVGGLFPVAPGTEGYVLELCDEGDPVELCAHVATLHRPPRLRTREGEPLVACTAVLEVADPVKAQAVLDREYQPQDGGWVEMHAISTDEEIIRAQLDLDGNRLTVTTHSEPRVERVLALLTAELETRTVSDDRTPLQPGELPKPPWPAEPAGEHGSSGPVDLGAHPDFVAQIQDVQERRWLDERIPALAGLTPRQAAADPTRREELDRLIASFPDPADLPAEAITMRPDELRRALGLQPSFEPGPG